MVPVELRLGHLHQLFDQANVAPDPHRLILLEVGEALVDVVAVRYHIVSIAVDLFVFDSWRALLSVAAVAVAVAVGTSGVLHQKTVGLLDHTGALSAKTVLGQVPKVVVNLTSILATRDGRISRS